MTTSQSDFLWFAQLSRDGEFIGTAAKPPRKPTLEYVSSLIETAYQAELDPHDAVAAGHAARQAGGHGVGRDWVGDDKSRAAVLRHDASLLGSITRA